MADEKKEPEKKSPIHVFREKLRHPEQLKETVLEGLKSTNARVRLLAVKMAFKLKDKDLIKKNVLPLISADKSKKVLRTLSAKITRKPLLQKVKSLLAKKKPAGEKPAPETVAAPKA